MVNHFRTAFNGLYCIAKSNEPFFYQSVLIILTNKCNINILLDYNNGKASKGFPRRHI
jgi:hypothetical protein